MARNLTFLLPCVLGVAGLLTARSMGDGTAGYYVATFLTAAVYFGGWLRWGNRSAFRGGATTRDIAAGLSLGLALAAFFVAGALLVSRIPVLAAPVAGLLSATERGGVAITLFVLVVNGVGEELIYRDMLPSQLVRRGLVRGIVPVALASVAIYTLVTVAMGVPLLLVGAVALGTLCHWLVVRTNRLYAPIAAHLSWSIAMLFLLPLFF